MLRARVLGQLGVLEQQLKGLLLTVSSVELKLRKTKTRDGSTFVDVVVDGEIRGQVRWINGPPYLEVELADDGSNALRKQLADARAAIAVLEKKA